MPVRLDVIARGATAVIDRNNPKARQDKWMLEVERAMLASTQPHAAAPFMPALADAAPVPVAPAIPEVGAANAPAARTLASAAPREAGQGVSSSGAVTATAYDRDEQSDADGDGPVTAPFAAAVPPPAGPALPSVASPTKADIADARVVPSVVEPAAVPVGEGRSGAGMVRTLPAMPARAADVTGGSDMAGTRIATATMTSVVQAPSGGVSAAVDAPAQVGQAASGAMDGVTTAHGALVATPNEDGIAPAFTQTTTGSAAPSTPGASGLTPVTSAGAGQAPAQAAPVVASFLMQQGLAAEVALAVAAAAPPAAANIGGMAPPEQGDRSEAAPRRTVGAARGEAESEPYAPSNVHVIESEDGIHAWVRDIRMTPYQEQAVALAMLAQFAQQGAPVGSVTVNGRLVGVRGDAERDEQGPANSTSEPPTAAESITTVRGAA